VFTQRGLRAFVQAGGVIAYPTESCYGLGCDPRNRAAVQRILQLKRRQQRKGLIVIAARAEQLARYVAADALHAATQSGHWPGPVSLLLPASKRCPIWLRGEHATLAVRVTAQPQAARLCRQLGMALVSTSANRAGAVSLKTAHDCQRQFGHQVRVIPGKIGAARRPSRIIDFATGRVLRP
jgi:L-threonylcarbamoyladenylate synthase